MRVTRPNCRQRFTAADWRFIAETLQPGGHEGEWWRQLLEDPNLLDRLLDEAKLFRALLDLQGCVQVSMPFYFYVLTRHALKEEGLEDRELADYVAALLCEGSGQKRFDQPEGIEKPAEYFFELLEVLDHMEGERRFQLMLHIGDKALFQAGIFPEAIDFRARRKAAPGIEFLEDLGRSHYRQASEHNLAGAFGLVSLLLTLGQAFHTTRLALNRLAHELVFIESHPGIEALFHPQHPGLSA